jgi:hypothetical protein
LRCIFATKMSRDGYNDCLRILSSVAVPFLRIPKAREQELTLLRFPETSTSGARSIGKTAKSIRISSNFVGDCRRHPVIHRPRTGIRRPRRQCPRREHGPTATIACRQRWHSRISGEEGAPGLEETRRERSSRVKINGSRAARNPSPAPRFSQRNVGSREREPAESAKY